MGTPRPRGLDIPDAIGTEPGKSWSDAWFRAQIRGAIRKVYFLWPGRKAVIDRSRIEVMVRKADGKGYKRVVWHVCEQCQQYCKPQLTPKQNAILKPWKQAVAAAKKQGLPLPERPLEVPFRIWCDHKEPVVSLDGDPPDWHTYIMRTFVDPSQMQAICDKCHSALTKSQNRERRENVKSKALSSE